VQQTQVVDDSNAIVASYDYYPFGMVMKATLTEPTKETFTGKELDEETGLYYFGARYYDAALGRWSVTDPAGQYATPYGYPGNPVSYVDPDGEFAQLIYLAYQGYKIYSYAKMAYNFYQGIKHGGIQGLALGVTGVAKGGIVSGAAGTITGGIGFGNTLGGSLVKGGTTGALSGGILSYFTGGSFLSGTLDGGLRGATLSGFDYSANVVYNQAIGSDNFDCAAGERCMKPDQIPEHIGDAGYDMTNNNINDMFDGGARVTSEYSKRDYGSYKFHSGLDIAPSTMGLRKYGTKVKSVFDGITGANQRSNGTYLGKGNFIEVTSTKNALIKARYFHVTPSVKPNNIIGRGHAIGYLSKTGYLNGPHVHLVTYYRGIRFNPRHIFRK